MKKMPFIALSIALACGITDTAQAQGWPNRTVRIVVPYAPGGGVSVLAQILGAKLSEIVKQPVVIDNRPGAGGNEPVGSSPEELGALYRADIERFAKVIADAKIPKIE